MLSLEPLVCILHQVADLRAHTKCRSQTSACASCACLGHCLACNIPGCDEGVFFHNNFRSAETRCGHLTFWLKIIAVVPEFSTLCHPTSLAMLSPSFLFLSSAFASQVSQVDRIKSLVNPSLTLAPLVVPRKSDFWIDE